MTIRLSIGVCFPLGFSACCLLQSLFEYLVAQNRFEESVHHLGNEPDLRNFLQGVHTDIDTLLTCRHHRRYARSHLVDMHYQGGK